MRRLIVSEFVSLDGVMEAPGGESGHPHSGWVSEFIGPEQIQYKLDELRSAASLLIGRITYESFASTWPHRTGEFADRMNAMPKHVVSGTLGRSEWTNTTVVRGNPGAEVERLKNADGGPILVVGSRTLVHTLLQHDLVDELRLMIFPVALGSGRRLFPESPEKRVLELADSRVFASGVVVQTYCRAPR